MTSSSTAAQDQLPPGSFSLNIFSKQQPRKLCKTNCARIEVSILHPWSGPCDDDPHSDPEDPLVSDPRAAGTADPQPYESASRAELPTAASRDSFPFVHLPLEIRRAIYALLLPAGVHRISTQLPHNGLFYRRDAVPAYATQSFYPGPAPDRLTTYQVHSETPPGQRLHPEILGVSRQICTEAEEVLYAAPGTVFDFGVYADACLAFWKDRSAAARKHVREIRIAREMPYVGDMGASVDARWTRLCAYLEQEMKGLRRVDLELWGAGEEVGWRDCALMAGLGGRARVTWWGFGDEKGGRKMIR